MRLPQPTDDFEWTQEAWGPTLRCSPLLDHAPHFFTTRAMRLESGTPEGSEAWALVAEAIDVRADRLLRLRQVHGAGVVTRAPESLSPSPVEWPEGDAAITNDPRTALAVRVADCVPLLLADPRTGTVAAVHAGWRGTAARVAPATVGALARTYGVRAADLVAAIGPSVGPCCYVVGPDLLDEFADHPDASAWFVRAPQLRLDLWRATHDQLVRSGVDEGHIFAARLCTACHVDVFCSYRKEGRRSGRTAGVIRALGGR